MKMQSFSRQQPFSRVINVTNLLSTCLVFALVLSACTTSSPAPTQTPPQAKVSVQFDWLHSASWAPFYIAAEKGYYAANGIEANLVPGGFDDKGNFIDAIEQVVS